MLSLLAATCAMRLRGAVPSPLGAAMHRRGPPPLLSSASQLAQLAGMTTLSIDTGDLSVIEQMAAGGSITDATTNPLFAGLSGDPKYAALVDEAVAYARGEASAKMAPPERETGCRAKHCAQHSQDIHSTARPVGDLIHRLLRVFTPAPFDLEFPIVKLVGGYVSTEVDPRLSFDVDESLKRARRIIAMYEAAGQRPIASQAVAAAQFGARLISPFPGRIKDWHAAATGDPAKLYEPEEDPGVVEVARMYAYGHDTICMPASWRPSRGKGFELDEIKALAGTDRMTIPPALLE
ncbi:MAG: hypothetical protein SGPRY_010960, partial [Prymnesium sp.]